MHSFHLPMIIGFIWPRLPPITQKMVSLIISLLPSVFLPLFPRSGLVEKASLLCHSPLCKVSLVHEKDQSFKQKNIRKTFIVYSSLWCYKILYNQKSWQQFSHFDVNFNFVTFLNIWHKTKQVGLKAPESKMNRIVHEYFWVMVDIVMASSQMNVGHY